MQSIKETLAYVEEIVSGWEGVSVHPHRFGGREFRLGPKEFGHVHNQGLLDILFTRKIRAQLVQEGKAVPHHLYPESGWTSFYFRNHSPDEALWLLRYAYLYAYGRQPTLAAQHPLDTAAELDKLKASPALRALLNSK